MYPYQLTPSPSPTSWERGAARGHVWSAEASASAWAEASLPHSIIPLARLRERGTQGVRATRRAHPFTPTRGKSPLPQRCCAEPMYPYQLTPSPSPTSWERGAARGHVWSAEASASAWAEASLPHSIIPLARLRERGTQGVRATRRAHPFTPTRGKSPLPQRCCAEPMYPYQLTPSPSPTMWERGAARGHVWSAEASASAWAEASLPHSIIPLARLAGEGDTGGEGKQASTPNAKQGRTVRAPLHDELHPRVRGKRMRAYFFRRRRPSKPARPAPNAIIDAGSGTKQAPSRLIL
jgi:hypothetical protein